MSNKAKQTIIAVVVIILVVIAIILGIRYIASLFRNTFSGVGGTPRVETNVTLDEVPDRLEIVEDPEEQYQGQVEFSATVDRVIGVRAFVIRNTQVFADDMLVISQDGIAPIGAKSPDEFLIKPGDRLLISGNLARYAPDELRRRYRYIDQTTNLNNWIGRPIIIATDLSRI